MGASFFELKKGSIPECIADKDSNWARRLGRSILGRSPYTLGHKAETVKHRLSTKFEGDLGIQKRHSLELMAPVLMTPLPVPRLAIGQLPNLRMSDRCARVSNFSGLRLGSLIPRRLPHLCY